MGTREIDPRLQKLYDENVPVYSISRLNTIHQCPYSFWMNYVKHIKPPIHGNVYSFIGSCQHDALEATLHGADKSVVKDALNEELENLDLAGVDFPLDRNGKPTIRNNYIANMTRFAEEYEPLKGEYETEQLILCPVDINGKISYMQGYIDIIKKNDDGSIEIGDWKTSSQFDKNHLLQAGRQLCLYCLAKEHEGFEVSGVNWRMLKYCATTWLQKNGKPKTKVSEWRNLIKDLKSPIEKALSDLGYDEIDIEAYLQEGVESNSWEPFPQEIKDKFTTTPYVREYELTPEVREETVEYITSTIEDIEERGEDEINYPPCDISKDSFFCATLCEYGGKTGLCKHWVDYCNTLQKDDEDDIDDLF